MSQIGRGAGFVSIVIFLSLGVLQADAAWAQEPSQKPADTEKTEAPPPGRVTIGQDIGQALQTEAGKVKDQLANHAYELFRREPLGFDGQTLTRVRHWVFRLPSQLPALVRELGKDIRFLGVVGSLIVIAFLGIVFFSLLGWKKILAFLELSVQPWRPHISEQYYVLLLSGLRILAATVIPLILLALFSLIQAFIAYDAPWFLTGGSLLKLWSLGAFIISALREILVASHLNIPQDNARTIYRVARRVILYILFAVAIFSGAQAWRIPEDILAFLRFVISLSIVFATLILSLRKHTIIGILPDLPYRTYQVFLTGFTRLYYPALFLTLIIGLLWCFGFKNFALFILKKTWAIAGVFLLIMLVFHKLRTALQGWIKKKEPADHLAISVHKSLHSLLIFATVTIGLILLLRLLGLYYPLRLVISFPLLFIGDTPLSLWTLTKIILLLLGFIFSSRLVRAYLDYKIYPLLGVDEGLAYSINTLLGYVIIVIGALFSLTVIGIDIRTLMVFAGAVGIGIGLGLQKVAANLVSGFIVIFGRKVRKGDWIKVENTVGYVRHISLGATTVWNRDNIEYIIPNSDLIASTIINYTLTSPEIRIHIPVGVSYNARPREVADILLATAQQNDIVIKTRKSKVWFTEYGDSSINFELLVWIDVRKLSEKAARSRLYFEIFEALEKAGIEIPFPQRDIHIRSGPPSPGQGIET